tara:strand:- start:230 stop:712 length:483 start_codon:yes stop_codon:yes gene_type:complete
VSQFAFGHVVTIKANKKTQFRYQNFFIGQKITHNSEEYQFAAFGFSGVTVNRTGDGLEATLVFPNNELTRKWAVKAIDNSYLVEVEVLIIEDADPSTGPTADHTTVHSYVGQVTGGQWDNVSLNLELSSVLDAVGTDVPRRSLTQKLVGNLPISNNVRLQ